MKVEALNCPNCGAGVESDRSQCQFCRTRLKTIACPKCFGLMFEGYKFCGHCGAIAARVEVSPENDVRYARAARAGLKSYRSRTLDFSPAASATVSGLIV